MGFETIFLITLIISLVIGNGLLSLFYSKPSVSQTGNFSKQNTENETRVVFSEPLSDKTHPQLVSLNQKLFLLSRQIQLDDLRISKLEAFRSNTLVEMKGVIEILSKLENKAKVPKKNKKTEKDLSTEEMHKIIYRSH